MFKMWILITEIMLFVCTLTDLRSGMVDTRILLIYVISGFILGHTVSFGGIIVGLSWIAVSYISREKIGLGDTYIFLSLGFFTEPTALLLILFISFIFAGIYSLMVFTIKNFSRVFPFVPFIFAGYNIFLIYGYGRIYF